jgi:L-seryl-tRNA(Ser) seleniumtransferase
VVPKAISVMWPSRALWVNLTRNLNVLASVMPVSEEPMSSRYSDLPSVDKVLSHPTVAKMLERYDREVVVDAVRDRLQAAREAATDGIAIPTVAQVAQEVAAHGVRRWSPWPVTVINATGVILHTNLGRAPLSPESVEAVKSAALGYSNLELDLDDGRRGSRHDAVGGLLRQLTGAQAALAVNNNAGAVLLGLTALARGRDVVVSRGEATEIGGGFRIPDVLLQSGARLVEVGTVNRTYAHDYAHAITNDTAAILVVHRSNFRVVGFTHQPSLAELSEIARQEQVLLLHDLGSGALLNTSAFGLDHEPTPHESIAAGADLVFFSGDKLLGGPQSGIAVGRDDLVQRLASHPVARALRADKLTMAALHATLLHYIHGEAEGSIPIWRMISTPAAELEKRASSWARQLDAEVDVASGTSTLGGGSLPGEALATWVLRIASSAHPDGATGLASALRLGAPPVMVRIEDDHVLLDPRTVLPHQDDELVAAVRQALGR